MKLPTPETRTPRGPYLNSRPSESPWITKISLKPLRRVAWSCSEQQPQSKSNNAGAQPANFGRLATTTQALLKGSADAHSSCIAMRPVSASSAQPASASASARQTINQTRGSSPAQAGATRPENSDKSSLTRLSERAVHANGGYGFKVDSRRISSSAATSPRPPSPKSKHEEEDRRRTKSKLESSSSSNPAQGPSSKDLRESESRRASTSPNASDRDTSRPNSSSSSSTTKRLQAADRHAASDPIWAKLEPSWLIPRDRDQDAGLVRKAPQKEKRIAAEGVQLPIADPRRNPKLAKAAGSSKAPLRNIPQLQRVQWTVRRISFLILVD